LLVEQVSAPTGDAVLLLPPDVFQVGENAVALRARAADGRVALSDERLIIVVPRAPSESFRVLLIRPGEAPREIAQRAPGPVPLVVPPPPLPALHAAPAPVPRANTPAPRRPLPDREVK
jgi:hypothetical protein